MFGVRRSQSVRPLPYAEAMGLFVRALLGGFGGAILGIIVARILFEIGVRYPYEFEGAFFGLIILGTVWGSFAGMSVAFFAIDRDRHNGSRSVVALADHG